MLLTTSDKLGTISTLALSQLKYHNYITYNYRNEKPLIKML